MEKEIILIVEDNRQIAHFWANELLPSWGFGVLVAHDGKVALELLRKRSVSLILLDLQLPDMSGLDLLRRLAAEGHSIPTILVTAHGSEQIAVESFHLGVQDYLIKPVDADTLNNAIIRALAETRLRREKMALTTQLQEQLSWQKILLKIVQSLTSSLELDEVLRRIVEGAIQITHAEEGFIALLDESTNRLFLRAAKNIDAEKAKTMRIPVSDALISKVLRTGHPVRTSAETAVEPLKLSTGFLARSLLHVPIISRGKALGVLTMVNRSSRRTFKEKDEGLLISLAGYAAIALENAALYEQVQAELAERRKVEEALRISEERYALAMQGSNDGLWDWDLRTNTIYFSPRWKAMIGFEEAEFSNHPDEWFNRVHPEDVQKLKSDIHSHLIRRSPHFESEYRILHKDGSYRWMLCRGLAVWDGRGNATRIAGSQTDITDRKFAEQKLLNYAFYDRLTGLPNRALFLERLSHAMDLAKRHPDFHFAILFMDLDRFKDVNDSLGHMKGDELLRTVGHLLQKRLRASDTIARFGGDEFVILLEDIHQGANAVQVANWILNALSSPIRLGNHQVYVSASIGIVLNHKGYQKPEEILRDADIAMYHAKAKGKSRYEIFDPAMRTQILERLELENDLRRALENRELNVFYQVVVALKTGQISGLEALVRWQHPEKGLLLPKDFIPVAEESGLIVSIERWVIREACYQLLKWQKEIPALHHLTMSVNITGKHLVQPDFVPFIAETLSEIGLPPNSLILEITEKGIVENEDSVLDACQKIHDLGIQIQIDDFGSSYSSLSYLSQLPIRALKIDQSFIGKMMHNGHEANLVQAVLTLSQRLGVEVIAEGIEVKEQYEQLKALGCGYGQGFFIFQPLNQDDTKRLLTKAT